MPRVRLARGDDNGMKRRLLKLLTLLSLLLCIAAVALSVRSYWRHDHAGWSRVWVSERSPTPQPAAPWRGNGQWTTWRYATVESAAGVIEFDVGVQQFDFATHEMREGGGFFWRVDDWMHMPRQAGTPRWRFRYEAEQTADSRSLWFTPMVPIWAIAVAFAVAPTLAGVRSIRRRRSRGAGGICPACGYDLTANVSGVCPECGNAKVAME